MEIKEALTFDDVLLVPNKSNILPNEANTQTLITNRITLNSPIMSSAMDTVTCLLYTSPSPRDVEESRMPSSA